MFGGLHRTSRPRAGNGGCREYMIEASGLDFWLQLPCDMMSSDCWPSGDSRSPKRLVRMMPPSAPVPLPRKRTVISRNAKARAAAVSSRSRGCSSGQASLPSRPAWGSRVDKFTQIPGGDRSQDHSDVILGDLCTTGLMETPLS